MPCNQVTHRVINGQSQTQRDKARHDGGDSPEERKRYEQIDRKQVERQRYEESKRQRQNDRDADLMDELYGLLEGKKDRDKRRT